MFKCFVIILCSIIFFFQAEDGIRDLVRSRGLGDVYKRQLLILVQIFMMEIMTEFIIQLI